MMMSVALGLLLSAGPVTTVAVENHSKQPVELTIERVPAHYLDAPRASLAPGTSDRIGSASGKIMLPHEDAVGELVTLRYTDSQGNGCVFTMTAVRHTSAWSKLKPSAMPIKRGKCEAATGRTIGDFIYVIR